METAGLQEVFSVQIENNLQISGRRIYICYQKPKTEDNTGQLPELQFVLTSELKEIKHRAVLIQ